MEEKEYSFTVAKSATDKEVITVKESDLTKAQKDLMLGQLIKDFNYVPAEVQDKFFQYLIDEIKQFRNENPHPIIKQFKEDAIQKLTDDLNKEINNEQEK